MPELVLTTITQDAYRSDEEDDPGPCCSDEDPGGAVMPLSHLVERLRVAQGWGARCTASGSGDADVGQTKRWGARGTALGSGDADVGQTKRWGARCASPR